MNWWIFCVLWYLAKAKGEPLSITSSSVEAPELKAGQANFAFNLLQKTGLENSTVISPISISVALGMVLYGAKGNTAKEIQDAIAKGVSEEEIHKYFLQLSNYIKENEGSIKMANKAYFSKELAMLESYKTGIEKFYNGSFQLTDFGDSQKASDEINTFVSEITDNEIKDIVSPDIFDALTPLVLVNAILFEKQWATKFRLLPNKKLFHSSQSSSNEITMMQKYGKFQYIENKKYKLVKIPYANTPNRGSEAHNDLEEGRKSSGQSRYEAEQLLQYDRQSAFNADFNMFIILPHEKFGLSEIVQNSNSEQLLKEMSYKWMMTQGNITIPTFSVESKFNLINVLYQLNIKDAFDGERADFSGITAQGLFVSDVLHKAFIKVTESGTKAGAATIVRHNYISSLGGGTSNFEFFADHPFLYLIADKKNNIYFIGTFFN